MDCATDDVTQRTRFREQLPQIAKELRDELLCCPADLEDWVCVQRGRLLRYGYVAIVLLCDYCVHVGSTLEF